MKTFWQNDLLLLFSRKDNLVGVCTLLRKWSLQSTSVTKHKILSNADCMGRVYTDSLPLLGQDLKLIIQVSLESTIGNSLPIPPLQSQPDMRRPKVHLTKERSFIPQ